LPLYAPLTCDNATGVFEGLNYAKVFAAAPVKAFFVHFFWKNFVSDACFVFCGSVFFAACFYKTHIKVKGRL